MISKKGNINATKRTAIRIIFLLPNLLIKDPDNGIINNAPPPKRRSKSPSSASLSKSLSFAKGTIGAQLDMARPQTRNINCVASFAFGILFSNINKILFFNIKQICINLQNEYLKSLHIKKYNY